MDRQRRAKKIRVLQGKQQHFDNQTGTDTGKAVPQTTILQDIIYLLIKIMVILIVFILLFTFMFGITRVKDHSMKPTIQEGDLIISYRLDKRYIASDVLVFEFDGKKQVRRVAAVAGDVVDITDEGVIINGALVEENETYGETLRFSEGVSFPLTVGQGQVFLIGDNRTNSVDSRMYGAVDIKATQGKVITIVRRRNI